MEKESFQIQFIVQRGIFIAHVINTLGEKFEVNTIADYERGTIVEILRKKDE